MVQSAKNEKAEMAQFTEEDPINENANEEENTKLSFCGKLRYVGQNITVEPTMVFFILGAIIMMITTQNLSLEKACRVNLQLGDEICQSLKQQNVDTENPHEKEVQKLLTKYISSRTYFTSTIPCFIALFAGSFSDITGNRKIFIIIPIVGQSLMCINNIINVYFFHELNLGFLTYSEALLESFSGGWSVPFFTMFAYISTVTTEKTRTFRMGLLNFAFTVGFPIGMGLSGVLLKKLGYFGAYGVSLGFHLINLIYTLFILKDPPRTPQQKIHNKKNTWNLIRLFFSLRYVLGSLRTLFRKGANNRRVRIIVYLIVTCVVFGPLYGEISVLYLLTRFRFNWDEIKFSIFQSYNFVTHTIGTIFSITVFSKLLGWHDSILGVISVTSKIASSFVYCFAPNEKIFFLAPLVEILNGTSMLAMRSLLSKLVEPEELGKVSSIISLVENLMPMIYVPLYTSVYKATMDVLPGAVFLMGSAMTLPALMVFIYLFYEHRKGVRRIKREEKIAKESETLMSPS